MCDGQSDVLYDAAAVMGLMSPPTSGKHSVGSELSLDGRPGAEFRPVEGIALHVVTGTHNHHPGIMVYRLNISFPFRMITSSEHKHQPLIRIILQQQTI